MNRLEFFQYVRKSVVDAVKYAASPFIEEDLKRLERMSDELTGIKWFACEAEVNEGKLVTTFINGKSVALFKKDEQLICIELMCKHCMSLLQWLAHLDELRCMNCDEFYRINEDEGKLEFVRLPVKKEQEQLYIGFIEGEHHA